MTEVIEVKTVKMHDTEFILEPKKNPTRTSLYKMVGTVRSHIKFVADLEEGMNYLDKHYIPQYNELLEYADALYEVIKSKMFNWDYTGYDAMIVTKRIESKFQGRTVVTEIEVKISAEEYITHIELTELQVMDTEVYELVDMFSDDAFRIVNNVFSLI